MFRATTSLANRVCDDLTSTNVNLEKTARISTILLTINKDDKRRSIFVPDFIARIHLPLK